MPEEKRCLTKAWKQKPVSIAMSHEKMSTIEDLFDDM